MCMFQMSSWVTQWEVCWSGLVLILSGLCHDVVFVDGPSANTCRSVDARASHRSQFCHGWVGNEDVLDEERRVRLLDDSKGKGRSVLVQIQLCLVRMF